MILCAVCKTRNTVYSRTRGHWLAYPSAQRRKLLRRNVRWRCPACTSQRWHAQPLPNVEKVCIACTNIHTHPAQLARQNQDLFEKLAEMQHNYELVSKMYDDMVAQNGAAQLKIERKNRCTAEVSGTQIHTGAPPCTCAENAQRQHFLFRQV